MYVDSNKIEVFPVAKKRIDTATGTRIFTEKNISNIIRQLLTVDVPGYIISCESNSDNTDAFDIAFNLYGYYFNIVEIDPDYVEGAESSVYACITIQDDEILGQDNNNKYEGLELVGAEPTSSSEKKYIKLFEKGPDGWTYSRRNFGILSAVGLGGIDGKN
jgi:hypothetical protein